MTGRFSLLDGHVGGTALPGYPPRRGDRTPLGDAVTAGDLARADVVAFELNGGGPGGSGGWESCEWLFEDGKAEPVRVRWDERAGARADADPYVVANGSTDGDRYSDFFGIVPPVTDGPSPSFVISYILVSLPTLRIASPGFAITLSPYLMGDPGTAERPERSEGTPDPDAVGVLACSHEAKTPKKRG